MKDKKKATRKMRNRAIFAQAVARGEPSRYNIGGTRATKRAVAKARRQEFDGRSFLRMIGRAAFDSLWET